MNLKLTESEYRFMTLIWDNEPIASGELVRQCAKQLGWKKSTTYTVLKKVTEKGFTQNIDYCITTLISREEAQKYASEYFVERTFKGSLPNFLVAFFGGKKVTEEEAEELKRLIDAHKSDC